MTWDTWAHKDRLIIQIDQRRLYQREHLGRIARKQSNGNQSMVDQLAGEIAAMEALLGGGRYPAIEDLVAHLQKLVETGLLVPKSVKNSSSHERVGGRASFSIVGHRPIVTPGQNASASRARFL